MFTDLFYFVKRFLNSAVIHYTYPVPYFNIHCTVCNNYLFIFKPLTYFDYISFVRR